jgi:antitoxin PrlF
MQLRRVEHEIMATNTLETTVTSKGQVTIPQEIRARLGLKPKDRVQFAVEDDVVTLRPAASKVLRWYGSVTPTQRPEDFAKGREAFERELAKEVAAEG